MADNILSDFGINILEEEIDDVIFQTNEFLCDATLQVNKALSGGFSRCVWHWLHSSPGSCSSVNLQDDGQA